MNYEAWGALPQKKQDAYLFEESKFQKATLSALPQLPFGNGKSYGDSCLNSEGQLIDMKNRSCLLSFDEEKGILECEAGILLSDIHQVFVPRGWFLPVSPGTQLITVGGAIANDIHGKNHHRLGSFGHHVLSFDLLRSDQTLLHCSPQENSDFFFATLGGLGLTGIIRSAKIKMRKISGPWIDEEVIRLKGLDDFFQWSEESDTSHEYTVAWIDCLASAAQQGRGLFIRGNHASETRIPKKSKAKTFPFRLPFSLINSLSLRLFNQVYYHQKNAQRWEKQISYEKFFYPLDSIHHWNRLYGPHGFYQYQCVIPFEQARYAYSEILQRIAASKQGSFLAVLKAFGDQPSLGLLSFPKAGVTLALDFPNQGEKTLKLFESLDGVVRQSEGRLYPAKDARMSAADFKRFYPAWKNFLNYKDPHFSSDFWRRVMSE